LSNQRRHKELAIWALRYLKNGEGISAYHAYQKAMGETSDSQSDTPEPLPRGFAQSFLNDVDSAILWLKSIE
jgi:hypothetical protein